MERKSIVDSDFLKLSRVYVSFRLFCVVHNCPVHLTKRPAASRKIYNESTVWWCDVDHKAIKKEVFSSMYSTSSFEDSWKWRVWNWFYFLRIGKMCAVLLDGGMFLNCNENGGRFFSLLLNLTIMICDWIWISARMLILFAILLSLFKETVTFFVLSIYFPMKSTYNKMDLQWNGI